MPSAAPQASILSPQRELPIRSASASGETGASQFEVLLAAGTGIASDRPALEAAAASRVASDFAAVMQSGEAAAEVNPPDAATAPGHDAAARTLGATNVSVAPAAAVWIDFVPASPPPGATSVSAAPAAAVWIDFVPASPPPGVPECIMAAGERAIPDTAEASVQRPEHDADTPAGPQVATAALPPVAAAPAEAMPLQLSALAVPAAVAEINATNTDDAPHAEHREPARPDLMRSVGDAVPVVAVRQPGEAKLQADVPRAGKPRGEIRLSGSGSASMDEGPNVETLDTLAAATAGTPGAPADRPEDRQRAPGGDTSAHRPSAESFRATEHAAVVSAPDSHAVPRFEPSSLPGGAHQPLAPANPIGALTGLSGLAAAGGALPPWTAAVPQSGPHADSNVPLAGLAVEIAVRALEGKRRFEIRLDPPELGRIDVRLDVARDGQVTSRLVVERAETLDLLRRDAPALERALHSAGLRTGESGLEFSLRDHSGGQRPVPEHVPRPHVLIVPDEDVAVREAVRRGYGILRGLGRGIDIRV